MKSILLEVVLPEKEICMGHHGRNSDSQVNFVQLYILLAITVSSLKISLKKESGHKIDEKQTKHLKF